MKYVLLADNPVQLNLLQQAQDQKLIDSQGQKNLNSVSDKTNESAVAGALIAPWVSVILQSIMIVGILSVLIFLVWGSVEWISAGGEKTKVEEARNKITGSILGLLVLASSVAIFSVIQNILGVHIFTFTQ